MTLRSFSGGMAALVLLAGPALAQTSPAYQKGTALPGHLGKFTTQGIVGDVGDVQGDADGKGVKPYAVTDGNATGLNVKSSDAAAHNELTLGHDSSGNAIIGLDSYGGYAAKSLKLRLNGTLYPLPQALGVTNAARTVATNADLALSSTIDFPAGIWRLDFAANRNAGPLFFLPQSGTCAAASMANDGGSCVDGAGGNSFKAVHAAAGSSFRQWGCAGDGTTDDTACVQAAFTAAGNWKTILRVGNREKYGISSTGITCRLPIQVIGNAASSGASPSYITQSGFTALSPNSTLFKLYYGCSGSLFSDVHIDMASAAGTNVSGAAITMGDGTPNGNIPGSITFERVSINYPCIGIDVNGVSMTLRGVSVVKTSGTGCGGVRVGHNTTGWTTADTRIVDSTILGDTTVPAEYGMLFEDAGSPYVTNNDIVATGTILRPGSGQGVKWGFFSNTVLGDQVKTDTGALLITTSTGAVANEHHVFDNVWGVVSGTSAATANVTFSTPSPASFGWFTITGGSRFFGGQQDTISALAGHDIHIRGNTLCGFGNPSGYGINIANGVNRVIITDNYARSSCGLTPAGTPTASIALGASGSNDEYLVTGNAVDPGTGISYTGSSTSVAIIKDNINSSLTYAGAIIADTCQGLDTGTCSIEAGSSMESWSLLLSPVGAPSNKGNVFFHFAGAGATNGWRCSANLKAGSPGWSVGSAARDASNASQPIVQWDNDGVALTSGQPYRMTGSCNRM
jgi:hypothetical protein